MASPSLDRWPHRPAPERLLVSMTPPIARATQLEPLIFSSCWRFATLGLQPAAPPVRVCPGLQRAVPLREREQAPEQVRSEPPAGQRRLAVSARVRWSAEHPHHPRPGRECRSLRRSQSQVLLRQLYPMRTYTTWAERLLFL